MNATLLVTNLLASSLSHHVDAGLEASVIGATSTSGEPDAAIGIDFVLAGFREHRAPRAHQSLKHRILEHALAELGGTPPDEVWPALARPELEVHLGGVFDFDGDRQQARVGIGSGIGPLGIGLGATIDHTDHTAVALAPELRIRHRVGPREQSPSLGAFLRADVFVTDRATTPDRIALGVFGMFDMF